MSTKLEVGKQYVIRDTRATSDCLVWWRPAGGGYTHNLDEAGVYDAKEAQQIQDSRSTDVAVPREIAMRAVRMHVTYDSLRNEIEKAAKVKA